MSLLCNAGGLLFILTLIHFFLDWTFQTQKEAMEKHDNPIVRAKHCLIYSFGFSPIMLIMNFSILELFIGLAILFVSHFILDTYIVVFLWLKYIRKPYEKYEMYENINGKTIYNSFNEEYFREFVNTQLGLILALVIDQITHIICLIPIVYMALN